MKSVCNAPEDGIGVYIIYRLSQGKVDLVFIGSYGKIKQSHSLKLTEKGLLKEIAKETKLNNWKIKMLDEGIVALDIYWFETFDGKTHDIPSTIKGIVIQRYFDINMSLPPWNEKF